MKSTYITLLGYGMIPTLHCSGMAWYLHYIRHKKSYLFTDIASNHDINTRYNNRLPTRLWLRLLSQFPLIFHYYINFHLLDSYVNCYCCSTVISIAIDTWQLYQFPFWYSTISISVQLLYQFLLIFDCYINFLWYSTITIPSLHKSKPHPTPYTETTNQTTSLVTPDFSPHK